MSLQNETLPENAQRIWDEWTEDERRAFLAQFCGAMSQFGSATAKGEPPTLSISVTDGISGEDRMGG